MNHPTPNRRLVSIDHAAEYAGVSQRTIRRRISEGHLVGYRMTGGGSRLIRVDLSDVDALFHQIPAANG